MFIPQSKWLFEDKEVQEDLKVLQEKYRQLGYEFSLEDCYNLWYFYSSSLSANWISVKGDVKNSLNYMKYIKR